MNEYIIPSILSLCTGLFGFYWGAKQNKVNLERDTLNNIQSQIAIYETLMDKLRDEIDILIQKVEEQKKTILHLEQKIEDIYKKRKTQNS